jgi:hypothetical protein
MANENSVILIPGKFSATEEAILSCLYESCDEAVGTRELMKTLYPDQSTAEQQQQAYKETQRGIENLIVARLIEGPRAPESGIVYHVKLRLTTKGEAEAINGRNRLKVIILDAPRPQRNNQS